MAPDALPKEVELTLDLEGGYVDHPDDPGGETKWGISRRAYPDLDIKNLSRREAGLILKRDYYDQMHLEEVKDDAVRWKLFDMAVNMGTLRVKIYAQRALKTDVDGIFGPRTLAAINEADPRELMLGLVEACVMHYTNIVTRKPSQTAFLAGWMKRALKRA